MGTDTSGNLSGWLCPQSSFEISMMTSVKTSTLFQNCLSKEITNVTNMAEELSEDF